MTDGKLTVSAGNLIWIFHQTVQEDDEPGMAATKVILDFLPAHADGFLRVAV